ncbi:amidohydrolase family protein [Streptomyces sp. NPDC008092]|uniref:amidohydrolase family protein n=1 Tax=Streptomyces sp. NPDC008092 TaxID=3364808 RepID=UPI0036F09778
MIDDHCHTFGLNAQPLDLADISLCVGDSPPAVARRKQAGPLRAGQELMRRRLATYLKCAPEEVEAARAEAARDWPAHVRALLADADIDELVFDIGSIDADAEASVVGPYTALTGRPVHWLARFDPLVDRLIAAGADAGTIVAEVEEHCERAARAGCAGFKTIAAYRTGLAVRADVTLDEAQRSLAGDEPVRRRGKACRDLALRRALGVAARHDLPVQFHTGFGDSDLRLSGSNPLLLEDLLHTEEGTAATVVLIHGGFPWTEELGYLALSRPNVYAELSLSNLFAPLTLADRIVRLLDLVPADRLTIGTDGHGQPETLWFAACAVRDAWQQAEETMTAAGIGAEWLARTRERAFDGNARELYVRRQPA